MVAAIESVKTKKVGQLKTELQNYSIKRSKTIQSIFDQAKIQAQANGNVNFKSNSIFDNPQIKGGTDSSAAQGNDTQKAGANSSSMNASTIMSKVTAAITSVTQKFNAVMDDIKNSIANLSALSSPQTTGQSVKPEENMPLDNKGSDNKAASGQDRQKPNVGFGQETVTDKSTTEAKEDKKADKEERESSTQLAQNASEIDKATIKKIEQQYDQHYQMGTNGIDSIFNEIEDMTTSAS